MNWAIATDNAVVVAQFFYGFGAQNMVVFLRDSISDKVELTKGKMNNKNMGVIKWADLFFGLREKREWKRKNVDSVV